MALKQGRLIVWDKERNRLTLEVDGKQYTIAVVQHQDATKKMVYFFGEQQLITIALEDCQASVTDHKKEVNQQKFKAEFHAPLDGMAIEVYVTEGQPVKAGDPLVVIEAMKMENILHAPHDAIIKSLFIQKGNVVHQHQVLMIFDEKGEDGYAGSNRNHE